MTRVCKSCITEKLLNNFGKRLDSLNLTYRWVCKDCTNKRVINNRKKTKCSIDSCYNVVSSKKLCFGHYFKSFKGTKDWQKKYWKSKKGKLLAKNNTNRRRDNFKLCSNFSVECKDFYSKCPNDMTVDHIIPLNSNEVCGLHVPWNLQYLTKSDNSKKRNKFDLTYDNDSWRQVIIVNLKAA